MNRQYVSDQTRMPQQRKQPRTLQQKKAVTSKHRSQSKLQPQLARLGGQTLTSQSVASTPDYESRRGEAGLAINQPATPAETSISTITGAGQQFNAFRVNEQSSLESYKQTMNFKLKDDIFRKLKFITNDAMMEFSMDRLSICQYICSEMHITGGNQGQFWMTVKDTVKRMVEKQRTNATSACKRAFQGKIQWTLLV